MKVTLKEQQKEFKPVELNIVLETQQEIDILHTIILNVSLVQVANDTTRDTNSSACCEDVDFIIETLFDIIDGKQSRKP